MMDGRTDGQSDESDFKGRCPTNVELPVIMSVKTEVIPFIPKQDLHPRDVYLYRNKALSDTELYFLITNVYKPKNFGFPETERSFSFTWFEEFPWFCYSR